MNARGVIGLASLLGAFACASDGSGGDAPSREDVPLCGPLASLAPVPEAKSCGTQELEPFRAALMERIGADRRALVRVELDDAAKVATLCVADGPGYGASSARRAIAEHLGAIRAVPGPKCAAGRRVDLNRYEAKIVEVDQAKSQCQQQVRTSIQTQPGYFDPLRRVHEREFENCMKDKADWIELDAPGTTRPWLYVKPEVPDPPGPPAYETTSRCFRTSRVFEKRVACIESDGWERLEPPPR
jgi:hypothetical protein